MSKPLTDPIGRKIFAAIRETDFDWRSAGGIARSSELTLRTVQHYLDKHQDWFDKAPLSPGGIRLYTVKRQLRR